MVDCDQPQIQKLRGYNFGVNRDREVKRRCLIAGANVEFDIDTIGSTRSSGLNMHSDHVHSDFITCAQVFPLQDPWGLSSSSPCDV